jgi:hypothetical protein
MSLRVWYGLGLLAMLLAGCGSSSTMSPGYSAPRAPRPASGALPWPRPDNQLGLIHRAGLTPARYEFFQFHIHAHLDVFVNGRQVVVPSGIGINIHDPGVQRFVQGKQVGYGGISLCAKPCIAALHTHDPTGIIHTESLRKRAYRLGQFFVEWGVRLTASCVGGYCRPRDSIRVFVDGKSHSGNPAAVVLTNHEEIAIVIGTPPKQVPASYDFSNI